jgi:hypothetical protein
VTMIATQPLTHNEAWNTMVSGECRLFVAGESVWERNTKAVSHSSEQETVNGAGKKSRSK